MQTQPDLSNINCTMLVIVVDTRLLNATHRYVAVMLVGSMLQAHHMSTHMVTG